LRNLRLTVAALALCSSAVSLAQTPTPLPRPRATAEPIGHESSSTSALPITRVALYKNGVGYFEHAGHVTGDQSVTIDFTSAQLNDVLQSLTAIDLNGGRISGAGYNSTTPLDQQLKTLALGLDANPSDIDFYTAIRGSRVQVTGPGVSISGRLLSIDLRGDPKKSGEPDPGTDTRRFLTVVSESGQVKTLEITPAVSVILLDTALHTDVTRYLELLASNRSQGLRHLTLLDRGTGPRNLRVSYISEVPVWKSTYRILFTTAKQAADPTVTLQGWSVVDNTTGEDWLNVHLDLIAGAPQSFIQPLSIPYYARRPEIGLPSEAQLAPQTHESGESITAQQIESLPLDGRSVAKMAQMAPGVAALHGYTGGRGVGGGAGSMRGENTSVEVMGAMDMAAPPPPPPVVAPEEYQRLAGESILPQTTTNAFDDFFEYTLTDPITIRKNESALVPILQTKLPVERVTLWSASEPVALRALWVTNSSKLTLDRGSFSIVEDGNFGGEGLLDPIHPGEKRLLSYAADQAVHVDNEPGESQRHLRSIVIAKGVLTQHFRDIVERDYTIRNAAPETRTVILEHNRNNTATWNLNPNTSLAVGSEPAQPTKPEETTPSAYRFRVVIPAGATVHLKVAESHAYPSNIQVGSINDAQIKAVVKEMGNAAGNDPALVQKLQPVIDAQRAVADIQAKKTAIDQHLNALGNEEKRQRDNITALKDADKLSQKRFVDELGKIEDQILDLQKQQTALDTQLEAARADLANKVQAVQYTLTLEP